MNIDLIQPILEVYIENPTFTEPLVIICRSERLFIGRDVVIAETVKDHDMIEKILQDAAGRHIPVEVKHAK